MQRIKVPFIVLILLARVFTLHAEDNPGKCASCSFSAVHQPYQAVRAALTADRLADARAEAKKLGAVSRSEALWAKTAKGKGAELARPWSKVAESVAQIERASSIGDARAAFGKVSEAMRGARTIAERDDLIVVYCPVVKLYWLQAKGEIRNPYGSNKPNCGQIVKK